MKPRSELLPLVLSVASLALAIIAVCFALLTSKAIGGEFFPSNSLEQICARQVHNPVCIDLLYNGYELRSSGALAPGGRAAMPESYPATPTSPTPYQQNTSPLTSPATRL